MINLCLSFLAYMMGIMILTLIHKTELNHTLTEINVNFATDFSGVRVSL